MQTIKFFIWSILIFFSSVIVPAGAEQEYFAYDEFEDGVINEGLWHTSGPVMEQEGRMILGTEGSIALAKRNFNGISILVKGYQSITVDQHVNIHLATRAPNGDGVTVGMAIHIISPSNPKDPPQVNNYVFSQKCENALFDPAHCSWDPLFEADWKSSYIFGLEYLQDGSVQVRVNGGVVRTYKVKNGELAFRYGTQFWVKADAIEYDGGGEVTAAIDWVKVRRAQRPLILIFGINSKKM